MSYHPEYGTLGTKLSRLLRQYNYELTRNAPKQSAQLTSREWLDSLDRHRQNVFNKYRRGAIILKEDYLNAKNSIQQKMQRIFFPNSNAYDEAKKQTALMQRQLAISQMSSGNLNESGLLKQIEQNFVNGNTDVNGEIYNYLLTHDINNTSTKIKALGRLNEGFKTLGLDEVNELKRDVETASGEFQELVATFQV